MSPKHSKLSSILHHEAAGGVLLLLAAALAITISNTRLAWTYEALLDLPLIIQLGPLKLDKPLLLWINDGLMAIFFVLVGLEIKKELLGGSLSTIGKAALPAISAVGGMIVPALIYVAINRSNPVALRGWAIPSATDIAFAVGVLTLLGPRVPPALKTFLLALAVLDDLGAIIIIALFYTADLSVLSLALAACGAVCLAVLNRSGVNRLAPYMLTGLFIWVCVLKSGVHATLAGVAVAIAIPMQPTDGKPSLMQQLESSLHPWVTFGVLPLFAFANAGMSLEGMSLGRMLEPIPLGIALGLFVGKTIGIGTSVLLSVASGLAPLPQGTTWKQLLAVAVLGGIGFTMSLFIGMLAFPEPQYAASLRIGVLVGSIASAVVGYMLMYVATRPATQQE